MVILKYQKMPFTRDQVEDINNIVKSASEELVKDQNFTKVIAEAVAKSISETIVKTLEERFKKQQEEIEFLKSKVALLEAQNKENEQKNDALEQYTRRNSLRVFGINEQNNENLEAKMIEVFKTHLKIDIKNEYIDRIHRVGRYVNGKMRAVIIKFVSYKHRALVFKNKKLLKNSGITIKEDLTINRVKVLKAAVNKYGTKNSWTKDGKIFISENNAIKQISSLADIV